MPGPVQRATGCDVRAYVDEVLVVVDDVPVDEPDGGPPGQPAPGPPWPCDGVKDESVANTVVVPSEDERTTT